MEFPLMAVPYIFNAALAVLLAWGAWLRRSAPGSLFFSLLMMIAAFWILTTGLSLQATNVSEKMIWTKLALSGMAWAAPVWLAMIVTFVRGEMSPPMRWSGLLWIIPALTVLFIATNDLHGLVWTNVLPDLRPISLIAKPFLHFEWGGWFWVFEIFSQVINLIGFVVVFNIFRFLPFFQKKQITLLVAGWALVWAASLVFLGAWSALPGLDPTPLVFFFTAIIYLWALIRYNLFSPGRIARNAVVNYAGYGYLVLDTLDRVVDVNAFARRFLLLENPSIGHPASKLLRHRPDILNMLRMNSFTQADLLAGEDASQFLEASLISWTEDEHRQNGRILILNDVTRRKSLEFRLQRHLTQQTFINDLLQILYRPGGQTEALARALERIGRHTRVDRVFLCQDNPDGRRTFIKMSWDAQEGKVEERSVPFLRYDEVPTWVHEIEARGMLSVTRAPEMHADLLTWMNSRGILALAAFPIYDEQGKYGSLVLENVYNFHAWNPDDLNLLKNAAWVISGAIARWAIEEAERRQRDLAEALRDMANVLNSTLNLEEVLDRALANLKRVVPHDANSIALIEGDGFVRFVRWSGYDEEAVQTIPRQPVSIEIFRSFQEMAETYQPLIMADTIQEGKWVFWKGYEWVRSYLGVPIQNKGRLVGFISLDSRLPEFFTPEHADRLRAFADDVGIAIENARLYREARLRAEEMSTLYRIGMTLTAGLEMDQVLRALLEECRQVLPVDVFYVALYDPERNIIHHPLFWEADVFYQIESRNIRESPGLSGEVILTRQTLYLSDMVDTSTTRSIKFLRTGGIPTRSYVGVPLIVRDQVVGVLSVQSYKPNAFGLEQIRLLETIATQAAVIVENARVFDQIKQMAITDPVTLLFTRRHFTMLGRVEVERAQRYQRELSVLLVDIDWFKAVNDTFGHNAGDLVLRAVAGLCKEALRKSDIVGRWGGEEFGVVLPETGLASAVILAERIRRRIEQTTIPIVNGSVSVTVSVGVSSLNETCSTLESLIDCADQALYQAKEGGRNKIKIWRRADPSA